MPPPWYPLTFIGARAPDHSLLSETLERDFMVTPMDGALSALSFSIETSPQEWLTHGL